MPDYTPTNASSNPPESVRARFKVAFGYALILSFVWETVGRPILCFLFPDNPPPPSLFKEIGSIIAQFMGGAAIY